MAGKVRRCVRCRRRLRKRLAGWRTIATRRDEILLCPDCVARVSGPSEGRLVDHDALVRANRLAHAAGDAEDAAIPHEDLAEHDDEAWHLALCARERNGRVLALVFLGCVDADDLVGDVAASWLAVDAEAWAAWKPASIDDGGLYVLTAWATEPPASWRLDRHKKDDLERKEL